MEIAILGGTGDIGEGLALRWAQDTDHAIRIGSRKADKAERSAAEYRERIGDSNSVPRIEGDANPSVTKGADVVVLAVPPYYVTDTIETIADALEPGGILVSPAVGMSKTDAGFRYDPPSIGSVTELVDRAAPDEVPVVGAFHNLAANRLATLEADLEVDTVVLGDDQKAKATILELAGAIDGLRAIDGGALENAPEVEAVTPLLINVAMNNEGMHDLGVRFA